MAGSIQGRVLSIPNEEIMGGELGILMGGARIAAAEGSEAMWFNPAGLAQERGRLITAGGVFLQYQVTSLEAESRNQFDTGPGSFSFVEGISKGRRYPRFSYGVSLAQTSDDALGAVIRDERLGSAGSLPFGLGNAAGIDTDFPGGIQVSEFSDGSGLHSVVSTSVGLGVAFSQWLRLGVSIRLERLRMAQSNSTALDLSGTAATNTLVGQSLTDWMIEGQLERLVLMMGLQLEISSRFSLGATLKRPSKTLGGSGSVRLHHNSRLVINRDALETRSSNVVWMDEANLPFQLQTPQVFRIGISFKSDWIVMALDLASTREQGAYEVFPPVESRSPSTTAARLNAITTSGARALKISIGVAVLLTERTSWLAGVVLDESPVPFDDPVFRKVDLTTYSVGIYHVRGRLSGSAGLSLSEAEERTVLFPALEGGDSIQRRVRFTRIGIQIGGSLAF
ncbi:MAG: hypothetical protein V3S64_15950 [bacterium]